MTLNRFLLASTAVVSGWAIAAPAHAAPESFIGQIVATGNTFCPTGFVQASGQLLSIAQNTALFSLLGTTYGGNGITTFGLPNLNGRTPIGVGQGPGLPDYQLGQASGSTTIQLTTANLPPHTHTARMRASNVAATSNISLRNTFAVAPAGRTVYSSATATASMRSGNINLAPAGGGQPISHTMPSMVIRYCIALQGIFPSRP